MFETLSDPNGTRQIPVDLHQPLVPIRPRQILAPVPQPPSTIGTDHSHAVRAIGLAALQTKPALPVAQPGTERLARDHPLMGPHPTD